MISLNSSIFSVILFLGFIFYKGVNNNFDYIQKNIILRLNVKDIPQKIIFNSKSGFYINSKVKAMLNKMIFLTI